MICFIILHYKNMEDTMECLESIKKIDYQEKIRTIVVDNNTTNKEEQKSLEKKANDFLRLNDNIGFAKANNAGCQLAIEKYHPDYLCVINSDTLIPQKNFIDLIMKTYDQYKFDMLGPKISTNNGDSVNPFPAYETIEEIEKEYEKNKKLIRIYKSRFLTFLLNIYMAIKGKIVKKTKLQNGNKFMTGVSLHGCFIIFSKKYYKKYKDIFNPSTFLYHEEEFLTYRRNKDSLKVCYNPNIEIFHKEGASLNYSFGTKIREKNIFRYTEINNSLEKLLDLYRRN